MIFLNNREQWKTPSCKRWTISLKKEEFQPISTFFRGIKEIEEKPKERIEFQVEERE